MRNRLCSKFIFLFPLIALFGFVAVYSPSARADEASDYKRHLEQWSQKLPDLEKSDTGETAKDIALIRSWIGQAQAYVASESFEKIDPILARMEAMVAYISVRQKRAEIENSIKKAAAKLKKLNQTVEKTKAEADAMLQEVKQLEAKK